MLKLTQHEVSTLDTPQTIPQTTTQPESDPQPEQRAARSTTRRKPTYSDSYNKLGYSLALIGAVGLAAWLWFVGAKYTVMGLALFGITTSNNAWFALPVIITAVELWLMPKKHMHGLMIAIFFGILAFDILTSWYGLTLDLANKRLPLGAGWQLPSGGILFHVSCIVVSFVFAFAPEKIARVAYREIVGLWL